MNRSTKITIAIAGMVSGNDPGEYAFSSSNETWNQARPAQPRTRYSSGLGGMTSRWPTASDSGSVMPFASARKSSRLASP